MTHRAHPLVSMLCVAALASAMTIATPTPAAARTSNLFHPPQQCELIEETGQLITIPWESEGCGAERDAFRFAVAKRMKFPGWYPPLTCVVAGVRYMWDAPSCAHARNQYADHKIRAIWFGHRGR